MKQIVRRVYSTYCPSCAENDEHVDIFLITGNVGEVKCPKCGRHYTFADLTSYGGDVRYITEIVK